MKKYMVVINKKSFGVFTLASATLAIMMNASDFAAYGNKVNFHEVVSENDYGTIAKPRPSYTATVKGIVKGKIPKAVCEKESPPSPIKSSGRATIPPLQKQSNTNPKNSEL